MITVIDYGMGNIRSVVKAVEKYTVDVRVSNNPESIKTSKALVMPGDGAFGMAMEHLKQMGWIEPLERIYRSRADTFSVFVLAFNCFFHPVMNSDFTKD